MRISRRKSVACFRISPKTISPSRTPVASTSSLISWNPPNSDNHLCSTNLFLLSMLSNRSGKLFARQKGFKSLTRLQETFSEVILIETRSDRGSDLLIKLVYGCWKRNVERNGFVFSRRKQTLCSNERIHRNIMKFIWSTFNSKALLRSSKFYERCINLPPKYIFSWKDCVIHIPFKRNAVFNSCFNIIAASMECLH